MFRRDTALLAAGLCIDIAFLSDNLLKITRGAWFPVLIGTVLCAVFTA